MVLSVRGIGEGHLSTIGFRTGTVSATGHLEVDAPEPFPTLGTIGPAVFDRAAFHGHLRALGRDGESSAFVLDHLGATFTAEELDERLDHLTDQGDTRRNARSTATLLRSIAARSYHAHFPEDTHLSERVLWPATAAESHGMEDARFVRFVDGDGSVSYLATYTAFDGVDVEPAAAAHHGLPELRLVVDVRTGRRRQGPGPLPATDRRPVRRALPSRSRAQLRRVLREPRPLGSLDARAGAT